VRAIVSGSVREQFTRFGAAGARWKALLPLRAHGELTRFAALFSASSSPRATAANVYLGLKARAGPFATSITCGLGLIAMAVLSAFKGANHPRKQHRQTVASRRHAFPIRFSAAGAW